jgi:hypothetical protein
MPVTFNKLGRFNAHGAIIRGKGLIELGHLTADGWGFFDQVNPKACRGKIESGLNTADPPSNDQNISEIALFFFHQSFFTFFGPYKVRFA